MIRFEIFLAGSQAKSFFEIQFDFKKQFYPGKELQNITSISLFWKSINN